VIGRILRHLGVPTEIASPRPARSPPLPAAVPDVGGWDDDSSVFNPVFLTFLSDGPRVGALQVCLVRAGTCRTRPSRLTILRPAP